MDSSRRTHVALETERRRIGQELHDEIGQRLTGILLHLQREVDDARPRTPGEARTDPGDDSRATIDEVGRIAWLMRPQILDDLGISDALGALIGSFADAAHTPVSLCVSAGISPRLGRMSRSCSTGIAQEALTNALRHAGASSIRVELEPDRNGGVRLEIADDGRGFDASVEEGPGIRGMRERALSVGAALSIESRRGVGVAPVRLVTVGTGAAGT